MCEEHFYFLPLVSGYIVGLGLAAFAGELACFLVGFSGDVSGLRFRAADFFGWTGLACRLQGTIFLPPSGVLPPVRIGVVPAILLEGVTLGADVLIIRLVPFEVGPGPGAIGPL